MQQTALLVLVNVPRTDWCFSVTGTRQLIGRTSEAPIRVPASHCSVSRRHAEIWHDKRSFWLCDLGSRCGTRVNGVWLKVNSPARIVIGDRMTLGGTELRLEPAVRRGDSASVASSSDSVFTRESDTIVFEPATPVLTQSLIERLTPGEHNVVLWMGRGYVQDDELAQALHRSPHTIRTQVANTLKKLGLHNRACVLSQLQRDGAALRIGRATRDPRVP